MEVQSLVNLSPLLSVMLLGLTVALGPLSWWWLQHKSANSAGLRLKRLQALTFFTLFLTFDLIIFGALTRLTDSGLGCPDWPGCYGSATPWGAKLHVDAAQSAMPTGPVTHTKAWIEMLHRYLATGVGVLILTLTAFSWWSRYKAKTRVSQKVRDISSYLPQMHLQINPLWPTASLVWVCVVGAFGALTVTLKLYPAIVTLHLLGALLLLTLLTWQAALYHKVNNTAGAINISQRLKPILAITFVLLWLQIALGGWVSTNYAVLACDTFPGCQKSFWPDMNFSQGFTIWRELGLMPTGESISFAALTAIHYTHRLTAYLLFIALGLTAWQLSKVVELKPYANWLIGLVLWQFFTGVSNAVMGWPLSAALAHTAGAAGLVMAMTWIFSRVNLKKPLDFKIQHRLK